MNDATPPVHPPGSRGTDEEIVADHALLRLAGFDLDRFLALSDFEQRLVLKMAEQLVNADRRAAPDDQAG
jgi:hypothetical protein